MQYLVACYFNPLSPSLSLSLSLQSLGGDDGLELTGASADDTEAELIKKILETEVGGAGGLLATFEPLVVGVVTNPSKYNCPMLQTSACLALAKYMLIRSVCMYGSVRCCVRYRMS